MITDHLPVLVETLAPSSSLPFPLYVQLGDTLILFRARRDRLGDEDLQELVAGEKAELYTPTAESEGYLPFLRDSFAEILSAPEDPEQKLRACVERGAVAAEHVLAHATARESHDCAEAFVGSLVRILEECAFRFAATTDLLRSHASLAEHSVRVSIQGLLLGRTLELASLEELGLSLLLHDVGIIGLAPEDAHPGDGSAPDDTYETHPSRGARLLGRAPWCSPLIRDVVGNHHERLDGSGFPRGLAADGISEAARVAAIVDTFDRRVAGRPGLDPRGSFEVLEGMLRGEEGRYDATMLEAFVALMAR